MKITNRHQSTEFTLFSGNSTDETCIQIRHGEPSPRLKKSQLLIALVNYDITEYCQCAFDRLDCDNCKVFGSSELHVFSRDMWHLVILQFYWIWWFYLWHNIHVYSLIVNSFSRNRKLRSLSTCMRAFEHCNSGPGGFRAFLLCFPDLLLVWRHRSRKIIEWI